jgi:ribose transport system substrate-binding protein
MKSLPALGFSALSGLALMIGCGVDQSDNSSTKFENKPLQIAVIPKGTTHEFWKSIHAGAVKAEREFNAAGTPVKIIWKGPLREDDRELQIQVVENFVSRKVDGIVLAPLDIEALVAPVELAGQRKIPVVVIDSGLNTDQTASYVSTDNYQGGSLAAMHMGKILKGKGKAILLRYQVGSASTDQREQGFLDTMKEKFPGIELVSTDQHTGATRDKAYTAAQNLLNQYAKDIDAVFAPCEPVTVGVLMALRDIGKAGGAIKLIGFDGGGQPVQALEKGDIEALILQNPVRMGYLGVKTMVDHLQGKPIQKRIDTGVHVITRDNMNEPEMHALLNPPLSEYLDE